MKSKKPVDPFGEEALRLLFPDDYPRPKPKRPRATDGRHTYYDEASGAADPRRLPHEPPHAAADAEGADEEPPGIAAEPAEAEEEGPVRPDVASGQYAPAVRYDPAIPFGLNAKERDRLRKWDLLVLRDVGVCRLLGRPYCDGHPEEFFLDLKTFDNREVYPRVPAGDVRLYDERDWEDPEQAEVKARLYGAGRWHRSCRMLRLFGRHPWIDVLEFLVMWQETRGRRREWFYCPNGVIVRKGFVPPATLEKALRNLRSLGLVDIRQDASVGGADQRLIRINYVALWRKLEPLLAKWEEKYAGHAAEGDE